MAQLPYRCAQCGAQWPVDRDTCSFCGSHEREVNPVKEEVMAPLTFASQYESPRSVRVPSMQTATDYVSLLSWEQAFDVVFKVMVAVAVWSAILGGVSGAIIWALFWREA